MVFAAGIFTGILSGTSMVDAMANSVIHYIPDAMGSHFAVVTAILSAPFTFFMSNDAFTMAYCRYLPRQEQYMASTQP